MSTQTTTSVAARELPPTGILQEWVAKLGLRHQGCLLTIIRGCDTEPKHSPRKTLVRRLRGLILHTHCDDPTQSKSFILHSSPGELGASFVEACEYGWDDPPHHYVMHLVHALSILAYHHPDIRYRVVLEGMYRLFCQKLHLTPETAEELDERLNADEARFQDLQ